MKLNFINEIRKELLSTELVNTKGDHNRVYRDVISDLRKEEVIFIPIGNYIYQRIEKCTNKQINNFINTTIASWNTQYFNSIVPIIPYMNDKQLSELHNGGLQLKER